MSSRQPAYLSLIEQDDELVVDGRYDLDWWDEMKRNGWKGLCTFHDEFLGRIVLKYVNTVPSWRDVYGLGNGELGEDVIVEPVSFRYHFCKWLYSRMPGRPAVPCTSYMTVLHIKCNTCMHKM